MTELSKAQATEPNLESEALLFAALALNLELSPEERIEAHEKALELMSDLKAAGEAARASQSQSPA